MSEELDALKHAFDRFIEVSKARMTILMFLGLTTVTMTGWAIQSKTPSLFFVAATIPALGFYIDILMKYHYAVVFLYTAASTELMLKVPVPAALNFLDFQAGSSSEYLKILKIQNEVVRRRKFRSRYVWSGLVRRLSILGSAFIVEIALGLLAARFWGRPSPPLARFWRTGYKAWRKGEWRRRAV